MAENYDAIVIGAGVIGAAVGFELSKNCLLYTSDAADE